MRILKTGLKDGCRQGQLQTGIAAPALEHNHGRFSHRDKEAQRERKYLLPALCVTVAIY
jgi:hypothetical protein